MPATDTMPTPRPSMFFLERGWLSANSTIFLDEDGASIVDTGYCAHASQTVDLLQATIGARPLRRILNTHLHSDHCGGNATLQTIWPEVQTWIAPGQAQHVKDWDPHALSYIPTGQDCPQFQAQHTLQPGTTMTLGGQAWEIHAAPGHDPHSILLFEPERRILISADALWENGFGVVFPEIEGVRAFEEVAATLDVIEALQPTWVLPGHGPRFQNVNLALQTARQRLQGFVQAPEKHARYAAKVLLKYKLLEWQTAPLQQVKNWCQQTPYITLLHQQYFSDQPLFDWLNTLIQDLVRSSAAALAMSNDKPVLHNR